MSSTRQNELTEEQRRMYASEKLDNFRWISRLVATRSSYTLKNTDLAPESLHLELSDIGTGDHLNKLVRMLPSIAADFCSGIHRAICGIGL